MRAVVLDIGHGPGTSNPSGAVSEWCTERDLVLEVGHAVGDLLADAGVAVRIVDSGPYPTRPNGLGAAADLILSLHADAQPWRTPYSSCLFWHHDVDAWDAALCILDRLGALADIERGIMGAWNSGQKNGETLGPTEHRPGYRLQRLAWGDGSDSERDDDGEVCLRYYPDTVPRVLVELGAVNHPHHRALMTTDRELLAQAVASGVLDYL